MSDSVLKILPTTDFTQLRVIERTEDEVSPQVLFTLQWRATGELFTVEFRYDEVPQALNLIRYREEHPHGSLFSRFYPIDE